MMYSGFKLFLSLGLGYVLCVLASKQKNVLKTLGYTIGVAIIVLSLLYALLASSMGCCRGMCKMGKMGGMGKKACPMMKVMK